MASHILDEVEKVCTHVAIIQKGVLKTVGPVYELMKNAAGSEIVASQLIELSAEDNGKLKILLEQMNGIESVADADKGLLVICPETITAAKINSYCFENGIILDKLNVKKKSLEMRFLEITGNKSDK